MTERTSWLRTKFRMGGLLLIAGIAVLAASLALQAANPNGSFDFRNIGGLGIGLGGSGLALTVRYGMGLRDESMARRIVADERDERLVAIRDRAGARAYWISALIVFGGLMWTSWASQGQLPALEGDALWNFLAVATVTPFAVYAASIALDSRNS